MSANTLKESEIADPITPLQVLNDRINHRYAVQQGIITAEQDKDAKFKKMKDVKIGFRDAREFTAYVEGLGGFSNWAYREIFTAEDKQELMQPVADYCKDHNLANDEFHAAHLMRLHPVLLQDMKEEHKEVLDFAIYCFSKTTENNLLRRKAKNGLFTANLIDIRMNPPNDEALLSAAERLDSFDDERDAFIEEHYVGVVEKKYAGKFAARPQ